MPQGKPDWGVDWSPRTVRGLEDLGEHAVRLGSSHLYDRRGDVYAECDFRNGMGIWESDIDGLLAAVTLHTGWARWGAYCVKLTGGKDDNHRAGLDCYLPFPVYSGIGLEYSFAVDADAEFWYWRLIWTFGGTRYYGEVRLDCQTLVLEFYNDVGAWTPFATDVPIARSTALRHTGKLVVDSANMQYLRFLYDDMEYSLVGNGLGTAAPFAGVSLDVGIRLTSQLGKNSVGYVDSTIVTQNEPI